MWTPAIAIVAMTRQRPLTWPNALTTREAITGAVWRTAPMKPTEAMVDAFGLDAIPRFGELAPLRQLMPGERNVFAARKSHLKSVLEFCRRLRVLNHNKVDLVV